MTADRSEPLPRLARPPSDPARPVRMVHLGPGAFFRAHQAWYTDGAGDEWGIAAVTGRSDALVEQLGGQGGVYTLLTRGPAGDEVTIVGSVAAVIGHADERALEVIADPAVAVITTTVTESGYQPGSAVLARLAAGLERRRRAGGPAVALLSCDNLADNGRVLHAALLAAAADDGARSWIEQNCAFPSAVVDRITPATTPDDVATVAELTGREDRAVVVTEPWSEWIIEDHFPVGRPAWEKAGARVVDDVTPFEQRKLRLLNGGHSLLAYLGLGRGHRYVHEAIADPVAHAALEAYWSETRRWMLPAALQGADAYCAAVEQRWDNPRLPHALAQIGLDGSLKLRPRVLPTVLDARAAGAEPWACAVLLGAWVAHVRRARPGELRDPQAEALQTAARGPLPEAARRILAVLDERLPEDGWLWAAVTEAAA